MTKPTILKYIAHSENCNGNVQTMQQHSDGVAEMMKSFALSDEYADIYANCGLLHDVGKYSEGFQRYIRNGGEKVPHAKWGAYMAKKGKCISIAYPIFGHHAGMPNRDSMFEEFCKCENKEQTLLDIQKTLQDDGVVIPSCDNTPFCEIEGNTAKELFIRLLYSSLVDADSLDTERHFQKEQYEARSTKVLDVDLLLGALNSRLNSFTKNSPLNKLRTDVRLYAQSLAKEPQGCFSMTLPTGMGKTLCSLSWALHHAKAHRNIKRIVIVLPFISIIDQTAHELKTIFKDYDVVLEHHSSVIYEGSKEEEAEETDSEAEDTKNAESKKTKVKKKVKGLGVVRGPVQLTFARSIDPIFSKSNSITRCCVTKEDDADDKDNTIGNKHTVCYGLYRMHGFISATDAAKTGFSEEDKELLFEALINAFENDRSAARGEMNPRALVVFKHDSHLGNARAGQLFDLVHVKLKHGVEFPRSYDDYDVTIDKCPYKGVEVTNLIKEE